MLLSRFWYVLLALALGGAAFTLSVAAQMYNHAGSRAMEEALTADSSAVDWFLRDDARKRSSAVIPAALSRDIVDGLSKASNDQKVDRETRGKVKGALTKAAAEVPTDLRFDAMWTVDANGRVVASVGFDHIDDWDLGGYASVADALHGWIRDDAWVWKGRIYRVVMRPVEREAQSEPVGAIIGAKIVDDVFARAVSKRTGAAVGFYADGARVASGAPEGFDKPMLDQITRDLKALDRDKDYQQKGRSGVRVLGEHLGVVYARHPGEAWELGAGYAVGHLAVSVTNPFDFLSQADNTDKNNVPTRLIIVLVVAAAALGIGFSILEHDRPLATFRREVARLARGEMDVFQPSHFRGAFKKIASDLNDGIEKVAAKGGAPRRAADLQQVLGPIPVQPAMSAFAVPGSGAQSGVESATASSRLGPRPAVETSSSSGRAIPRPPGDHSAQRIRQNLPTDGDIAEEAGSSASPGGPPRPPPRRPPSGTRPAVPPTSEPQGAEENAPERADDDEIEEWRRVFEEFLAMKRQCNEDMTGLSFEKFKGTLQRNKDALVARQGCSRVKFTVYVKDGKAALKASPVK
jgi:hypothetical protein